MAIARTAALALAAAAAVKAAATACSGAVPKSSTSAPAASPTTSATAGAVSLPSSPVGLQARWLLGADAHLPIPVAQVTAHFDQTFRTVVSPSELNTVLAQAKSLQLDSVTTATPTALVMIVTANGSTKIKASMAVDSSGLISGLLLQPDTPAPPVPTS